MPSVRKRRGDEPHPPSRRSVTFTAALRAKPLRSEAQPPGHTCPLSRPRPLLFSVARSQTREAEAPATQWHSVHPGPWQNLPPVPRATGAVTRLTRLTRKASAQRPGSIGQPLGSKSRVRRQVPGPSQPEPSTDQEHHAHQQERHVHVVLVCNQSNDER